MRPRVFKRWGSRIAPTPRKGRKGHLYVPPPDPPPPTPEEEVRITQRRHQKAERDERMDITRALTPSKTYMGGFTRPKDLRAANWFPGGPYLLRGKIYESPPVAAYEPHTVFLLESRYRVRHGIGRVDSKEHVTAVCHASDFVKLMAKYNSASCPQPARECMDNACWPFIPGSGKVLRSVKWWGPGESPMDIMKEIYEEKNLDTADVRQTSLSEEEFDEDEGVRAMNMKKTPESSPSLRSPEPSQLKPSPPPPTKSDTNQTPVDVSILDTRNDTSAAFWTEGTQQDSATLSPRVASQSALRRDIDPNLTQQSPSSIEENVPTRAIPPHITQQTSKVIDKEKVRAEYIPRLATEPFWLPLLAVTVTTRPLALSIVRLAKAHERGLPFYAAMSNDDRKCLFSYSTRMTNFRINRFLQLTREVTMRLAGHKGGFVGIRFGVKERGRGINGEGLADPIPLDKRIIKVQVGRWYLRGQEVYESFEEVGKECGGDALEVAFMNHWGRRLDSDGNELPLTAEEMFPRQVQETEDEMDEDAEEEDADEYEADEDEGDEDKLLLQPRFGKKFKPALRGDDEASVALRRKLALRQAQNHRSVVSV